MFIWPYIPDTPDVTVSMHQPIGLNTPLLCLLLYVVSYSDKVPLFIEYLEWNVISVFMHIHTYKLPR